MELAAGYFALARELSSLRDGYHLKASVPVPRTKVGQTADPGSRRERSAQIRRDAGSWRAR